MQLQRLSTAPAPAQRFAAAARQACRVIAAAAPSSRSAPPRCPQQQKQQQQQHQQQQQRRRQQQQRRRLTLAAAAGGGGGGGGAAAAAPSERERYGALTERLVGLSSVPFTFIVVPQVLQNHAFIAAGEFSALAAISWVGWCAGLAGNALMAVYLASRREATAVRVQLIGTASNLAVLGQLWHARVMPTNAFAGVLATSLAVGAAAFLASRGRLSERQWLPFEALAGAAGAAATPQVLASAFAAGAPGSVAPSLLGLAAAAAWLRRRAGNPKEARRAVAQLPGLCATAMFALSPLPQLARSFSDLSALAGLSLGTMLLALLGNAVCIPRALFTRDAAWSFGATWGCTLNGWAQLLSLYLGRSADTGARFLPAPAFFAVTAALAAWLAWVTTTDARVKGLAPLGSYPDVFFGPSSSSSSDGGGGGGGKAAAAA